MTDQNSSERTRRTFMKGAAATGVAATGVTAFSGSAAAQEELDTVEADNLIRGNSLISVTVQDSEILSNIDITLENIEVDILSPDGDQEILSNIRIRDVVRLEEDAVTITVQNVLNRILQQVNVDNVIVQVNVLSDAGDTVATGGNESLLIS